MGSRLRFAPQVPGTASKRPDRDAPQVMHRPSSVSAYVPSSYQSRSMSVEEQRAQYVDWPRESCTLPV